MFYGNHNPDLYDSLIIYTDPNNAFINGTLLDPAESVYFFFTKNQVINTSSLSGYYADVQFQNNSRVKAELFAVSSEVTESSK